MRGTWTEMYCMYCTYTPLCKRKLKVEMCLLEQYLRIHFFYVPSSGSENIYNFKYLFTINFTNANKCTLEIFFFLLKFNCIVKVYNIVCKFTMLFCYIMLSCGPLHILLLKLKWLLSPVAYLCTRYMKSSCSW